jgi:hypothetical protein
VNELLAGRIMESWADQSAPRTKERNTMQWITLPSGMEYHIDGANAIVRESPKHQIEMILPIADLRSIVRALDDEERTREAINRHLPLQPDSERNIQ